MVESVVLGRVVNYDHKDEEKKVIKNIFFDLFFNFILQDTVNCISLNHIL